MDDGGLWYFFGDGCDVAHTLVGSVNSSSFVRRERERESVVGRFDRTVLYCSLGGG